MTTSEQRAHGDSSGEKLLSFVYDVDPDDPPNEAMEMARKCLVDTVGVAIAGSEEPATRIVDEYVDVVGADGEATVLGRDATRSHIHAALSNGVQGHALDFDDVCYYGFGLHPSVTIVPTLLAAGETAGSSGEELLSAFVATFEFEIRVAGGAGGALQKHGYHPTAVVGTFGSTVAAGRLLGLDREQFGHAVGIASSLYSGLTANFGTMVKPLHAGLANQNGMQAALLAERGFTANDAVLEESTGPWPDLFEEFDLSATTDDLGERWYTADGIGIKIYPACGCTHGSIDAARAVHDQLEDGDTVESVRVYSTEAARDMLRYDSPETGLEGKFSMQYCVAAALRDDMVTLDHFTDESVAREDLRSLVDVVEFRVEPELASGGYIDGGFPGRVVVTTDTDRTLEETVRTPTGTPEVPTSDAQLKRKFLDCAARGVEDERASDAYDALSEIRDVSDVTEVTALFR